MEKKTVKDLSGQTKREMHFDISVAGHDFDTGTDIGAVLDSFATTGFQALHLHRAIEEINRMRANNAKIFFGYTSNLVSSGLRDIFRFIAKHRLVDVIVTTAGGIEEDLIKTMCEFKIADFSLDGKALRADGWNRVGNLLIPNEGYVAFSEWLDKKIDALVADGKTSVSPSELIRFLGREINDESSIYYWAYKNNIPVYCPAITDGSIGDILSFRNDCPFEISIVKDIVKINREAMFAAQTGCVILGGGTMKHHILNANLMKNGADFCVIVSTAAEYDGSDSGASLGEAVSWGKMLPHSGVKVFCDATIAFPLIALKTFCKWAHEAKSRNSLPDGGSR